MSTPDLKRLLRGAQRRAVEDAVALFGQPVRLETASGRVLVGDEGIAGTRHPIRVDGSEIGALVGPEDAAALVRIVEHLVAREVEKRALANETLGRYKELTLLYAMSDQLSKMLDLDAVASHVVEQANRHLHADAVALFLCEPGSGDLQLAASLGHDDEAVVGEVASRVFRTGQSELVEHDHQLVLGAPLRHGDAVFGVLRATRADGEWTSGDLKLVTAVAANAASALRKAQLHARQVRELALRHQVQRHVSSEILEAVFDGEIVKEAVLAVLFCDLRAVSASAGVAPDALVEGVEEALADALQLLLGHGAVVDLPLGEMLVAVFWEPSGFDDAAQRALAAATELVANLAARAPVGVGVASGDLPRNRRTEALHAMVHAAAQLHEEAPGRVLADARVRRAVGDSFVCTPWPSAADAQPQVFEVNAP